MRIEWDAEEHMIEEPIEALLGESGTNSLCGRLKVEPWALFFSEKGRLAAEEAARALRLLRAEVKARGLRAVALPSRSARARRRAALCRCKFLRRTAASHRRGKSLRVARGPSSWPSMRSNRRGLPISVPKRSFSPSSGGGTAQNREPALLRAAGRAARRVDRAVGEACPSGRFGGRAFLAKIGGGMRAYRRRFSCFPPFA